MISYFIYSNKKFFWIFCFKNGFINGIAESATGGSNSFSIVGNLIIGGQSVELVIPMPYRRWEKNADTQMFKIIPYHDKGILKVWVYADRSIMTFRFGRNSQVFSDVCDYLFTSYTNTINWTYKNPYE